MSKIQYYMLKNPTGTPESFRPSVIAQDVPLDMFVSRLMVLTGLSREQVLLFIKVIGPALGEFIAQGGSIDWPDFALFKPLIVGGTVTDPNSQLPATKRGDVSMLPRGAFKTLLDGAETERVDAPATTPQWQIVTSENDPLNAITNRTVLKITGKNLSFNATRADEGLFLRSQADNSLIKTMTIRHTAQKIDALLPSAPDSDMIFTLELHTRGARGAASRELEIYVWSGTLTSA